MPSLNRRFWQTANKRPATEAACRILPASSREVAIGFSLRTWHPRPRLACTTASLAEGTATSNTISGRKFDSISSRSVPDEAVGMPNSLRSRSAAARSMSTRPVSPTRSTKRWFAERMHPGGSHVAASDQDGFLAHLSLPALSVTTLRPNDRSESVSAYAYP